MRAERPENFAETLASLEQLMIWDMAFNVHDPAIDISRYVFEIEWKSDSPPALTLAIRRSDFNYRRAVVNGEAFLSLSKFEVRSKSHGADTLVDIFCSDGTYRKVSRRFCKSVYNDHVLAKR